jgi:hypothetical protein
MAHSSVNHYNVARRGQWAAVAAWVYYHAVSVLKLTAAHGSAVLLIGGTISTAGLVLGVKMSEWVGRVKAVVIPEAQKLFCRPAFRRQGHSIF